MDASVQVSRHALTRAFCTNTYQSADGLAWVEASATSGVANMTLYPAKGLAVTDAGCLVTIADGPVVNTVMYSVDAGRSWRSSPNTLVLPGFTALTYPKMIASPTGFWAMNSGTSRWSENAGLAPALA